MRWRTSIARAVLICGMVAIGAGCAGGGKNKPLAAPAAALETRHRLASATAPASSASSGPAVWIVSAEWLALKDVPTVGTPIASAARLIASDGSSGALLVSPKLLRGAQWLDEKQVDAALAKARSPEAAASLGSSMAALPPGVRTTLSIRPTGTKTDSISSIQIELARARSAATRPVSAAVAVESRDAFGIVKTERAGLGSVASEKMRVGAIVPVELTDSPAKAVLVVLRIAPADGAGHEAALARCAADLQSGGAATRPATDPTTWAGNALALEQLAHPQTARRALLYLADNAQATICRDVALAADEAALAKTCRAVLEQASARGPVAPEAFAWMLDSAAISAATATQGEEKTDAVLIGVLLRVGGEAARHQGLLDELARASTNASEFESRLLAENLAYLDDSSPASRARALDWLKQRGRAPAGYDPLASPRDRRAALDKAMAAEAGGSR